MEEKTPYSMSEHIPKEPPPNYEEAMSASSGGYHNASGPPTSPEFVQPADYGAAGLTITPMQPTIPHQTIVVIGGCPACRVGSLEEHMTLLGILCGILLFPIGLICCLTLTERKCTNCGAKFEP